MGNPFSKLGVTDEEYAEALADAKELDDAVNDFMKKEVVPYWKSVTPVLTGKARKSIKVTKKAKNGTGEGVVSMTDWKAHFLEFGTGEPGPTKAFAPGEKTAQHFGGTLGSGIAADTGDDEE